MLINKNGKLDEGKMREIVIQTDGTNIHVVKAEVGGVIEFVALLETIIGFLNSPQYKSQDMEPTVDGVEKQNRTEIE